MSHNCHFDIDRNVWTAYCRSGNSVHLLSRTIRGGEWYLEKINVGLGKFRQDLEISEAFLISLEVSFLHGLFLLFLSLETFYQRVSGSDF